MKKERPIKSLYLFVTPTGVMRSGNSQEIKIGYDLDDSVYYPKLAKVEAVIKKNDVIPSGRYIDTGNGDIFFVMNVANTHIRVVNVYTYPHESVTKYIYEPGLYKVEGPEEEATLLKQWAHPFPTQKFRLHWFDGKVNDIVGFTIADAIQKAGFALGSMKDVAYFTEIR